MVPRERHRQEARPAPGDASSHGLVANHHGAPLLCLWHRCLPEGIVHQGSAACLPGQPNDSLRHHYGLAALFRAAVDEKGAAIRAGADHALLRAHRCAVVPLLRHADYTDGIARDTGGCLHPPVRPGLRYSDDAAPAPLRQLLLLRSGGGAAHVHDHVPLREPVLRARQHVRHRRLQRVERLPCPRPREESARKIQGQRQHLPGAEPD
mmetsp:Transcript_33631/g.104850  ORF Transcript_33631/g.104850 Transcript_33631/m.104850 type:complete len:208 (+) Transcript_33631:2207-2830(+)